MRSVPSRLTSASASAARIGVAICLALSAFVLGPSSPAFGCSCVAPGAVPEALAEAAAVFTGTVSEISGEPNGPSALSITLTAEETWKGVEPGVVTVATPSAEASCGFNFERGRRYLVYAAPGRADGLTVSLCSRTALASTATGDLTELGPGKTLRDLELDGPGTNRPHPFPTREAILAGVLIVVVLSLGGAFLLWRMDNDPDALER